ncbi:class F sortase [Sphaerisporangium corydalis]|uniref:Class F sortase n=1 Tax=Sphaerisporangium corydalis TaxID=1441875 RepID=A0ABV9ER26_9ACTN|nr:class F sortase [Sphaerisporangium corydalis]
MADPRFPSPAREPASSATVTAGGRRTAAIVALPALIAAGVILVVVGGTRRAEPPPAPLPDPAPGAAAKAAAPRSHGERPAVRHQPGLRASSIRVPALGVTARIGRAEVEDGVLVPPRVPGEVGMWAGSAPLEAATGEVTIAGHVSWGGMAPFAFRRLARLRPGQLIYTADAHGRQSAWRVTEVTALSKRAGTDPTAFAGPAGPRRLVLITCGGAFDASARSYDDNVYVFAVPA